MEIKWLEDFVVLAETGSFSRSAQLRHVSQPAFSRRVQSLEAWVGAALIDRSTYPTKLTPAGEVFIDKARELLEGAQSARAFVRGRRTGASETVVFAVPHAVSFSFFPHWFVALEERLGPIPSKLVALNVHDAVLQLVEGSCDLLICYHHASQPFDLDSSRYEMLSLARETLQPVCGAHKGRALHKLPGTPQKPLPYLFYTPNAYLAQITESLVATADPPLHLERCYETDIAEGLKMLVMQGKGIAFLPGRSVAREIEQGLIKLAHPKLAANMEVRLYRERPTREHKGKPLSLAVWDYLAALSPARRSLE
jgi:LysR family transcriptional regulator, hypochlorite-specific transcription factor HypT